MPSNLALAFANAEDSAGVAARSLGRAARNLRKFRERTGLSVAKLARATGLPQTSIQGAEGSSDDYLPFDVVEPMVPVLTRHGTSLAEILMLLILPERLRLLRKSYGLHVRDLATLLGHKSGSGYQHYETASRFDKDEFPADIVLTLIPEFRRVGAKPEEVMTIIPLSSFTSMAEQINDLLGADDTTIALVRRVLGQEQSAVEPVADAGKLMPVLSDGGVKKLSIEMRAAGSVKRTEDVQGEWEEEGLVSGWQRVAAPCPFGFLMSVFSNEHSKHFAVGETLEIDRADRTLVDGKHYLATKGEHLHLGRYDAGRHALISESQPRRSRLQVMPITDACIVVGRVVRAIVERSYD
jgi:transcriptional regulator with XRE-family HTH domain